MASCNAITPSPAPDLAPTLQVACQVQLPEGLDGSFNSLAHYLGPLAPVAEVLDDTVASPNPNFNPNRKVLDNTVVKFISGANFSFSNLDADIPTFNIPPCADGLTDVTEIKEMTQRIPRVDSVLAAIPLGTQFQFGFDMDGMEGTATLRLPKSGGVDLTAHVYIRAISMSAEFGFDFVNSQFIRFQGATHLSPPQLLTPIPIPALT